MTEFLSGLESMIQGRIKRVTSLSMCEEIQASSNIPFRRAGYCGPHSCLSILLKKYVVRRVILLRFHSAVLHRHCERTSTLSCILRGH